MTAEFGLSGETATNVEVHYKDGSTDTYVVGSEAGESAGRYLLKDGVVYISASFSKTCWAPPGLYRHRPVHRGGPGGETVDSEGSGSTTTLSGYLYRIEVLRQQFQPAHHH